MFAQVQLVNDTGKHVAYVSIPFCKVRPDVLWWGTRTFSFHRPDSGQPANQQTKWHDVYREVMAVAVVPIPYVAANDGRDPKKEEGQ